MSDTRTTPQIDPSPAEKGPGPLSAGTPAWSEAFRQRVRLLQRLLALAFTLVGAVLIYLGVGPLVHRGSGWIVAVGAFCLLAGGQAILFGPYYLAWLEQHRRAPQ